MKWLFQQAKTAQGSKRKEQAQGRQSSKEDVTTVISGA